MDYKHNEKFYIVEFKPHIDDRGKLLPFEYNKNCPFDVKRIFLIYDVPNREIIRGEHVNEKSKTLIVAVSGSVMIDCYDEQGNKQTFNLNNKAQGLYISNGVYRKLYNFEKETVLLCLSDCYYDSMEYISE